MSRYDYGGWAPYVPVAQRRANAMLEMIKLREQGQDIQPVKIQGRTIARSFWGKGWCDHLESFGDYSNRLPRGRTYVRNGSVCHLGIDKGKVDAIVSGSDLYRIEVEISPLAAGKWKKLTRSCTGRIGSLLELLQGRLSEEIMSVVTDRANGLFPLTGEISYKCNCPDWASMCKHIAATMYGIGARLDAQPELLFLLRGVDHEELITTDAAAQAIVGKGSGTTRTRRRSALDGKDLAGVFGVELEDADGAAIQPKRRSKAKAKARARAKAKAKPKAKRTTQTRTTKNATATRAASAKKKSIPTTKTKAKTATSRAKVKAKAKPKNQRKTSKSFKPTADAVRALRSRLGMNKTQFAWHANVSLFTLSKWENAEGELKLRARSLAALTRLNRQRS